MIIGGGVMGVSIAFHLAEAGVNDVVMVEADQLGRGSTSKAAGGVRLQFSDEINIELALRSPGAARQRRRCSRRDDLHARGFSGHGFLLGPAVGEVIRFSAAADNRPEHNVI